MEEERGLGNIIFYIIAAVIAIISSIKRKKPVPGSPGGGPVPESRGSGFPDDMFDEEEGEYSFPQDYEEGSYSPEPAYTGRKTASEPMKAEREGSYEEPMAASFAGEGVSALTFVETTKRFEELLKETSTMGYDWSEQPLSDDEEIAGGIEEIAIDFDGRKAVIYSEILARKEY